MISADNTKKISASAPGSTPGTTNVSAMAMVTTLFFMWAFLTEMNDVIVPHLKSIFALNYVQAQMVQLTLFGSYFVFALPAGKLIEWIGYKKTMVVGLLTIAAGAILFVPAATAASFHLFLGAEVLVGAGLTTLQVAANPYVTVLGPPESASSRLNLAQAFNSLGATLAPLFGGWLILGHAPPVQDVKHLHGAALQTYRSLQASSVKVPYIAITGALVVLALAIAFYKFPRLAVTRDIRPAGLGAKRDSLWKHPHLYLGAIGIFIYVGAEVSIGSFLINYFNDPKIGGFPLEEGAKLVTFYWGGMMVGRFIGSAVMKRFAANKLLALCGVGAAILTLLSVLGTGHFAVWTILAVGLFNSIMFPTIFTLAVAELGPLTGRASGLLCQAIVGAAIIPEIMGYLADHFGIHHSMVLPFLCYLYVIYYGLSGYRIAPTEEHSRIQPMTA